jgi:hypothetical protein
MSTEPLINASIFLCYQRKAESRNNLKSSQGRIQAGCQQFATESGLPGHRQRREMAALEEGVHAAKHFALQSCHKK